jgi:hypothetical protein
LRISASPALIAPEPRLFLDAMLSAQAERERYREMLLRQSTELEKPE